MILIDTETIIWLSIIGLALIFVLVIMSKLSSWVLGNKRAQFARKVVVILVIGGLVCYACYIHPPDFFALYMKLVGG